MMKSNVSKKKFKRMKKAKIRTALTLPSTILQLSLKEEKFSKKTIKEAISEIDVVVEELERL